MYAKIVNSEVVKYPYTISDLKKEHPTTSFPNVMSEQDLQDFNLVLVKKVSPPSYENGQKVKETTPTVIDGEWTQTWLIESLSEEELESVKQNIRNRRNNILREFVDNMNPIRWESMSEEQKINWKNYREALLDITDQENFPWNITWPDSPE